MKKYSVFLLVGLFCLQSTILVFASEPFRFALLTDLHINPDNPQPAEDLRNAVNDVNALKEVDFVLVTGDISNYGDSVSLRVAKQMLNRLRVPYYILPGNHDIKWNEAGATNFLKVFQDDKFMIKHKGYLFIGFTTAPLTKSENGIIRQEDIDWVKASLKKAGKRIPCFAVTHYPLLTGDVDNWKAMTAVLKKYNVQAVLNGHYHRNALLNEDEIPGVVNRTIMRGKNTAGGYSLYSLSDSLRVYEKKIGTTEELWLTLPFVKRR